MEIQELAIDCETLDETIENLEQIIDTEETIYFQRRRRNVASLLNSEYKSKLNRRLHELNIDETEFLQRLSRNAPFKHYVVIFNSIEKVIEEINSTDIKCYNPKSESLEKVAFEGILSKLVNVLIGRLIKIANIEKYFKAEALNNLARSLLERLSDYLAPSLFRLFTNYKKLIEKRQGELNIDFFSEFESIFWLTLAKRYLTKEPIAGVIAFRICLNWLKSNKLLISRFNADVGKLSKVLKVSAGICVKNIICNLSDPHDAGKMVCILYINKNLKIVYKPRSSLPENIARDFVKHIFENCFSGGILIPDNLDCATHSWHIYVDHDECDSLADVHRFYFNVGCALSIFKLTGGSDFHQENIIAKKEMPGFVDLETLIQPSFSWATGHPKSVTRAYELLYKSVYKSHLLPATLRTASGELMKIGGLLFSSEYQPDEWGFININTNSMDYKKLKFTKIQYANLPKFNGITQQPSRFIEDILIGYRAAASQYIYSAKIKARFKFDSSSRFRVIVRPTESYYSILNSLKNPKSFDLGLKWSSNAEFEYSTLPPVDYPLNNRNLTKIERLSLLNLDIPYFNCKANSRSLFSKRRVVANKFFDSSPNKYFVNRLRSCERWNEHLDTLAIRLTLEGAKNHQNDINNIRSGSVVSGDPSSEVKRIWRLINEESIKVANTATFISRKSVGEFGSEIGPLGYGMYTGICGIAIFTAGVAKHYHFKRALSLTESLIQTTKDALMIKNSPEPKFPSIIGIDGIGGIIYSASLVYDLCSSSKALELAIDAMKCLTVDAISNDQTSCIIWGRSGALLGLNKLYSITRCNNVLYKIVFIADILVQDVENILIGSRAVVLGMAHGISGIALSLFYAFKVTNDKKYFNSYQSILDFLLKSWSSLHKEWPIAISTSRNADVAQEYLSRWCDGSAGILLMLIKTGFDKKNPEFFESMFQGASDMSSRNVDFLCCGSFGYNELLRVNNSHSILPIELPNDKVGSSDRINSGYRYDAHGDAENISLFRGSAGIGYSLLRSFDESMPCILSFE